jgi:hypothetical protein
MAILSSSSRVVFEVKDYSHKRRALDFIIGQAKYRAHRDLSPLHEVSFNSNRPFQ